MGPSTESKQGHSNNNSLYVQMLFIITSKIILFATAAKHRANITLTDFTNYVSLHSLNIETP